MERDDVRWCANSCYNYFADKKTPLLAESELERAAGIEPVPSAWEAEILPLNYARVSQHIYYTPKLSFCQDLLAKKFSGMFRLRRGG